MSPTTAGAAMELVVPPMIGIGGTLEMAIEMPHSLAPTEEIMHQEERGPIIATNESSPSQHGMEVGPEQLDGNHAWVLTLARTNVEGATVQQDGNLARAHTYARTVAAGVLEQQELGRSMAAESEQVGMGKLALSLADIAEDTEEGEAPKEVELAALTEEMTRQEAAAFAKLKTFCSNIVKRLAPPLLKEVQASALRVGPEPCTPRAPREPPKDQQRRR
ncbi:hypothetical protein VPH35_044117 [Triticum aestivum]